MCLHDNQVDDLEKTLGLRNPRLDRLFKDIDSRNAQATVESDRVSILQILDSSLGFDRVNAEVAGWLQKWVAGAASKLEVQHAKSLAGMADLPLEQRKVELSFLGNVAWLMESIGDFATAKRLYMQVDDIYENDHASVEDRVSMVTNRLNLEANLRRMDDDEEASRIVKAAEPLVRELHELGQLQPQTMGAFYLSLSASIMSSADVDVAAANAALREGIAVLDKYLVEAAAAGVDGKTAGTGTGTDTGAAATTPTTATSEGSSGNGDKEKNKKEWPPPSAAEVRDTRELRVQLLRQLAANRYQTEDQPGGLLPFLDDVLAQHLELFDPLDDRVQRLRHTQARCHLIWVRAHTSKTASMMQTGAENADYMLAALSRLRAGTPLQARSTRVAYFCLATDIMGEMRGDCCNGERLNNVTEMYKLLVQVEEQALDLLRQSAVASGVSDPESSLDYSNLVAYHFAFARLLLESGSSASHARRKVYIAALEKVAEYEPQKSRGRLHLQKMLHDAYEARGYSDDAERAAAAMKLYVAYISVAPNNPQLGLDDKRTQQYVAIIQLAELGQHQAVLEMVDAARAIDDAIAAKVKAEGEDALTPEEKTILAHPQWTQYNPNWLNHNQAKALAGMGRAAEALEACNESMKAPIGGVDLSENPHIVRFRAGVKAQAGLSVAEVSEDFTWVLTRFGYWDTFLGPQVLEEWLQVVAKANIAGIAKAGTDPDVKRRSRGAVVLGRKWLESVVLKALAEAGSDTNENPLGSTDAKLTKRVWLAVLAFRVRLVCERLNDDNSTTGAGMVFADVARSTAWMTDAIESGNTLVDASAVAPVAPAQAAAECHKVADVIYSSLNDLSGAVEYFGLAMKHVNRAKHSGEYVAATDFPFTPTTLYKYASCMHLLKADVQKYISVLENGISELRSTDKYSVEDMVEPSKMLLSLLAAVQEQERALPLVEFLFEFDSLLSGQRAKPSDLWVNPHAVKSLINVLYNCNAVDRAEQYLEFVQRHREYQKVIALVDTARQWVAAARAEGEAEGEGEDQGEAKGEGEDQGDDDAGGAAQDGQQGAAAAAGPQDNTADTPATSKRGSSRRRASKSKSKSTSTPRPASQTSKSSSSSASATAKPAAATTGDASAAAAPTSKGARRSKKAHPNCVIS